MLFFFFYYLFYLGHVDVSKSFCFHIPFPSCLFPPFLQNDFPISSFRIISLTFDSSFFVFNSFRATTKKQALNFKETQQQKLKINGQNRTKETFKFRNPQKQTKPQTNKNSAKTTKNSLNCRKTGLSQSSQAPPVFPKLRSAARRSSVSPAWARPWRRSGVASSGSGVPWKLLRRGEDGEDP